ncbi:MAG: hypothetical protein ABI832_24235, partial [bacterium]
MPTYKSFDLTLGDISYLLDQMHDALRIMRYDLNGHPIYGYIDASGTPHDLGTFDQITANYSANSGDPLTDPLAIYAGARAANGFRIPTGFFNNLINSTTWTWGATNDPFPRLVPADYSHHTLQNLSNSAAVTYQAAHPSATIMADSTSLYQNQNQTVIDYTPRMITQTVSSSYFDPPTGVSLSAMERIEAANPGFITDSLTSVYSDGSTHTENVIRNLNTLPGDPSTSGIFTLFGQFFDHGLDFIDKGGQGSKIIIPLSPDDPLYRAPSWADPGNTTITISRATPDDYTVTDLHGRQLSIAGADNAWGTADDLNAPGADGVYGTGDDIHAATEKPASVVYTNHTSPYIDQSQSYGSDSQTTYLLREWVVDPTYTGATGGADADRESFHVRSAGHL